MLPRQSDVERLFEAGEFSELLRRSQWTPATVGSLDPRIRITFTHALALTGQFAVAKRLVALDIGPSALPVIRSRASSIQGLIAQAEGDIVAAGRHLQAAVRLALEAGDLQRIGWAYLHLFRQAVDGHPSESFTPLLPEVRKAVTKAGHPHLTAYLHVNVSALEGQAGRFDEARRHCDVAESILELAPNKWLAGTNLANRACIAYVTCDLDAAVEYTRLAKQAMAQCGHARGSVVLDNNLGHIETMRGRFDQAHEAFRRVLNSPTASAFAMVGAYEGLARLHLAVGELSECEQALQRVDEELSRHEGLGATYHARWAAITRARLLLKHSRVDAALEALKTIPADSPDIPLRAVAHLVRAQGAALQNDSERASWNIAASSEIGITAFPELQAQYYFVGALVGRSSAALSQSLRARALRLWQRQRIVSVRPQIEPSEFPNHGESRTKTPSAECVINTLASAIDLAHDPRLFGSELQHAIAALGCSPRVTVSDQPTELSRPAGLTRVIELPLGKEERRHLTLVCELPPDPTKAILLGDVLRLGRAAISLERARRDERSRAALWPASPAEEQTGALFLAEEMQNQLATARRIAPTGVPVLITGETGTGKEVLARMIHAYSTRAARPFLPFNCSATPKEMLDSQLFGHRRGSFTGASEHFSGIIRAAAGGTLFLDEIGETTLDIRPKLLRFLESSEVHPIGETQPVNVDVRVIAATNADLDVMMAQGRFREDLFYRLNIVRLHLPPLRERRVEIPALANHYLQKYAHECAKGHLRLAEETMEYLVLYRWPGNVRQLANEMRRLAALAEPGAVLMPEHLSPDLAASRRTVPASQRALDPTEVVVRLDQPMAAAIQHLERAILRYALTRCQGRIEETATLLGVSRKGLYLKRRRYGLDTPGAAADVA